MSSASVTVERTLPCGVSSLGSLGAGGACTMNSSSSSPSSVSSSWPSTTSGTSSSHSSSIDGASTCVARTTGSACAGSGGSTRSGCGLSRANSVVERLTRRVVRRTLSDVARIRPAIDAPVRSMKPATNMKMNRMWAPISWKRVRVTQKSPSPTAPPWWRNQPGVSSAASRGGSSGPRPKVPAARPSMSAVSSISPPALNGLTVGTIGPTTSTAPAANSAIGTR